MYLLSYEVGRYSLLSGVSNLVGNALLHSLCGVVPTRATEYASIYSDMSSLGAVSSTPLILEVTVLTHVGGAGVRIKGGVRPVAALPSDCTTPLPYSMHSRLTIGVSHGRCNTRSWCCTAVTCRLAVKVPTLPLTHSLWGLHLSTCLSVLSHDSTPLFLSSISLSPSLLLPSPVLSTYTQ